MVLRLLIAGVLIAHGLIHLGLGFAPRPGMAADAFWSYFTSDSWILERWGDTAMRACGFALLAGATIGFKIAGLAHYGQLDWWRGAAIAAATISLLLMVVFWHASLRIGVSIDLVILLVLLALHWPSSRLLGI